MQSNTAIKSCPFCGGEIIIEKNNIGQPIYFARCTGCQIQTRWYTDKDKLISDMNRRAKE